MVLEMPNLSPKDLKWRFLDATTGTPFTAKMRDQDFINRIAEGSINGSLRTGINMTVTISFKEHRDGDEWVENPLSIEVTRVSLDD